MSLTWGVELSVEGPKTNSGQRLFHPVGDAHDDDGMPAALNPVPKEKGETENR